MPAWGWFIDSRGARRCATLGLVFWGVSTLICGFAPNYLVLLGGPALLDISEGFLWPLSNVLTARWFPVSERGRAQSVWLGAINLGFALSGFVINGAIGAGLARRVLPAVRAGAGDLRARRLVPAARRPVNQQADVGGRTVAHRGR